MCEPEGMHNYMKSATLSQPMAVPPQAAVCTAEQPYTMLQICVRV